MHFPFGRGGQPRLNANPDTPPSSANNQPAEMHHRKKNKGESPGMRGFALGRHYGAL
jgi:hypothetical protein